MDCSTQASLSTTNSQSLLKLMFIELVMPSNHLILCCSFLLLPSIFPSIRIFSNESVLCIRWPKHWSFSFSISPSNEYEGLISFRIDWFDRLSRVLSNTTVQKPSAVILEPKKIKSDTVSTVSPSFPMKWWDQMPWSSFSECWALSQPFHSPLSL